MSEDAKTQASIEAQAIMKSIWESGIIPYTNDTSEAKAYLTEMFNYSLSLIDLRVGVVVSNQESPVPKPSYTPEPKWNPPAATPERPWPHPGDTPPQPNLPKPRVGPAGLVISEAQSKRFYAIAKSKGMSKEGMAEYLKHHGIASGNSRDIPYKQYNSICEGLESL